MDRLVRLRRGGWDKIVALAALALLLAGCATGGPAPVVNNEQGMAPPTHIIVQHGQTLSGIARAYHVPMPALAEANRLAPPYRILAGQALIVPTAGEPEPSGPSLAMGEPTAPSATPAPHADTVPLAPVPPISAQPIEPVRPASAAPAKPPSAAEPPLDLTPPSASVNRPAPLTPPEPAAPPGERKPASVAPPAAVPNAPGPMASAELPPAPKPGGASFLWPVRGHVVEGFGAGPEGTRNDGINIVAPRGMAIEATDGGVVAYSGNELRGYGNLVLIKHPGGWISAYAHCDQILVKAGQKVARGQVIARVGSTGNVSQPQVHFELRRGKKPVDPREYLAPLSTATAKEAQPG